MNDADRSTSLHSQTKTPPHSIVAPVLTWAVLQLAALALSAGQVRLWARPPLATDAYAPWMMLAVQVGGSALLFPWLMRNAASTAFVIGSAAPCLLLAGMLSSTGGWKIAESASGVVLWLLGVALWNRVLVSDKLKLLGIAILGMLVIGSACLFYLRMEFTPELAPNLRVGTWVGISAVVLSAISANLVARR
ncbi:MAG TPA: hypothetical protein VH518_14395 [Tepidisphaeraceae bacterium]|jgi:hypothetical protein